MPAATIGYAILAAIVYSVIFYGKKHFKPDNPDSFDMVKFTATVIIGAIIGIVFYVGGLPPTAEAVEIQLGAYAGIVALTETILKTIYRILRPRLAGIL